MSAVSDKCRQSLINAGSLWQMLAVSGKCRQSPANVGSLQQLQVQMIIRIPANAYMWLYGVWQHDSHTGFERLERSILTGGVFSISLDIQVCEKCLSRCSVAALRFQTYINICGKFLLFLKLLLSWVFVDVVVVVVAQWRIRRGWGNGSS